uniref:Tc1-like transposase DDE domain-containing protein n=1 Tax=Plectus sambesii TaxID=2011161 RepID=A0A914V7T4_9BILA
MIFRFIVAVIVIAAIATAATFASAVALTVVASVAAAEIVVVAAVVTAAIAAGIVVTVISAAIATAAIVVAIFTAASIFAAAAAIVTAAAAEIVVTAASIFAAAAFVAAAASSPPPPRSSSSPQSPPPLIVAAASSSPPPRPPPSPPPSSPSPPPPRSSSPPPPRSTSSPLSSPLPPCSSSSRSPPPLSRSSSLPIYHSDKAAQTAYIPVKMNNRRSDKGGQCSILPNITHKPLCGISRLCPQSKWFVKRLVDHNTKNNIRPPQQAAARALGLSEKAVSRCCNTNIPDLHASCNDPTQDYSHAPSCRTIKKRMTQREQWERAIKNIDALIIEKIKRLIHDEFYRNSRKVAVNRLLKKLQEEMEVEGGFKCSESNFRLILNGLGYRFRKINFRPVVFERKDLIAWRKGYLRELHVYRQRGYRIVYTDETWVFAGMSQKYDWVDEEALRNPYEAKRNGFTTGPKTPVSRGKRAIVVHCVAEDGLVEGADFIFASHATDDDGDYHRDMDAAKFEAYLTRIAPILKAGSDKPVVLVLDNASSHSRFEEKLPTKSMTGNKMKDWLRKNNIPFLDGDSKQELLDKRIAPLNKADFNRHAVERIALEHGVIILRLPPYHCDLNPIESVWGWIKRQLRDELRSDDKLKAVMAATKLAFKNLPQSAIRGFFSHVREAEQRYAALDEILLDNPACELVTDAATFVDDSDSGDDVEVDVME